MDIEAQLPNIATLTGAVVAIVVLVVVVGVVVGRLVAWLGRQTTSESVERGADFVRTKLRRLLLLVGSVACIGVVSYGLILMNDGQVLHEVAAERLQSVSREVWIDLATAFGKVVGLLIATFYLLRLARTPLRLLAEWGAGVKALDGSREQVDSISVGVGRLVTGAAWLGVIALSTLLLQFPQGVQDAARVVWLVYLIVVGGQILRRALHVLVTVGDAFARDSASPDSPLRYYGRLAHLLPLLRSSLDYVVYVTMATLIVLQVEAVAGLAQWGRTFITIIGILFLSRVVVEVTRIVVHEALVMSVEDDLDKRNRRATITPLIATVLAGLIYFGAGVACLKELGLDPMPILAGAGIFGIAVGLGAQAIINDMLSGFFLLFESYFVVGDFVEVGDVEGFVERIDLRTTRIRDSNGRVHLVPNGDIRRVTNSSKEFVNAVVDVGVDYASDLAQVEEAIAVACAALRGRTRDILEDTKVIGLEAFGSSELVVRTVTKVRPGRHRQVQRDLRVEIKHAFDAAGVEIPFAHRVLVFKDPSAASAAASPGVPPRAT